MGDDHNAQPNEVAKPVLPLEGHIQRALPAGWSQCNGDGKEQQVDGCQDQQAAFNPVVL
jgi:hypothetical protein